MHILNVLLILLDDPEPLQYDSIWKGWWLIPILIILLAVGYWVRKNRK